jgi:hypothetical protein
LKKNDESKDFFELPGITLIVDFLSEAEEEDLVCRIDNTEWLLSQSGRRKQVSLLQFLSIQNSMIIHLGLWTKGEL